MHRKGNKKYQYFIWLLVIIGFLTAISHSEASMPTKSFRILSKIMPAYSSIHVSMQYKPTSTQLVKIPPNQKFTILVQSKLPTALTFDPVDSLAIQFSQQKKLEQVIYNFQNYDLNLTIDLTYIDNKYFLNTINNTITINGGLNQFDQDSWLLGIQKIDVLTLIQQSIVLTAKNSDLNILDQHFIAIVKKEKVSNFMLPFNLISLKKNWVFVNYINSDITNTSYPNEPFLPTFWNELGQQNLLIPWLPYFSECTGVKKRILLKDLLKPAMCKKKEDAGKISIEVLSPIVCLSKKIEFECLLEEYNVENKRRDEWYSSSSQDIFYLHPYPVDLNALNQLLENSDVIEQVGKQMYQQIPVLMKKNIAINEKPVQFVFRFELAFDDYINLEIVSAQLEINRARTIDTTEPHYSLDDPLSDRKVSLVVIVDYLSQFDKFYNLHKKFIYYIPVPIAFIALTIFIASLIKRHVKMVKNFQTSKFVSLVLVPMFKGLLLSMCTILSFILGFYFITKGSSFSVIGTTYDGDDSIQSNLQKKYNGRIGLALIMSGVFIIMQVIKQTLKIPTPEQMKINLEDALEENHEIITIQSQSSASRVNSHRKIESLGEKDINFIIKTLESRRSELLLKFFFALVVFEYNYKLSSLQGELITEILIWVIFIPMITVLMYKFFVYFILNDIIYAKAALIVFQAHSYCSFILKADTLMQIFFYWFLSGLAFAVITPIYLIKFSHFCTRLAKQQNPNFFELFLLKRCNNFIKSQSKLSFYEKGISFSSILIAQVCSIVLQPFMFALVQLTFTESKIFSDVFVNSYSFKIIVFISIIILPALAWILIGIIQFVDKFYDLGIFKVIELNQFTFRNRKVKWMSDIFRQNPTIADWLKEYEKFHFSSQLYFLLFSLAFAGIAVVLGLKIIFENKYICFVDPALMFMFIIIWTVGNILSVIISFLAVKFKFYEKKEEVRMRTKLESIEKLVRKKEYTKYLQLNAVKEHFLYNYKDWVINNIQNIFTKSIFLEDNGRILKKFKFYKNLLKRKNIMKKRSSILEGRVYAKENEYRVKTSEKQIDYEISQDQTFITVNSMLSLAKTKYEQSNEAKVIKISKQKFNDFAKPLLYYWFYTAKQNTFLKGIIAKIRQEKMQDVCEFCNMDLDLENIEKHDIQEIINNYRVINVSKSFVPDNFIEYYRSHQEFITVCFQCKEKKLYLQKKRIKNIKYAKIIVMNWLVRCRSRMLHLKHLQKLSNVPNDFQSY